NLNRILSLEQGDSKILAANEEKEESSCGISTSPSSSHIRSQEEETEDETGTDEEQSSLQIGSDQFKHRKIIHTKVVGELDGHPFISYSTRNELTVKPIIDLLSIQRSLEKNAKAPFHALVHTQTGSNWFISDDFRSKDSLSPWSSKDG
ncbi:hypothetical protein PFISCL1PPCAC_6545, partial [Pristionchus fissidentatus]